MSMAVRVLATVEEKKNDDFSSEFNRVSLLLLLQSKKRNVDGSRRSNSKSFPS